MQRLDDEHLDKAEQRSHRGTKRTYFFKETSQKVTAVVGQTVVLLCRVKNLGNRTVSFARVDRSSRADARVFPCFFFSYGTNETTDETVHRGPTRKNNAFVFACARIWISSRSRRCASRYVESTSYRTIEGKRTNESRRNNFLFTFLFSPYLPSLLLPFLSFPLSHFFLRCLVKTHPNLYHVRTKFRERV